jgi:hypothetical protein
MSPAPGKAELDRAGWLQTEHIANDAITTAKITDANITTAKLSAAGKIKRACSNVFDLTAAGANVGLLYTSTAITITAVQMYRITATVGTSGAIDVGINADDDAVVSAQAVAAGNIDTLLECTIAAGAVAAGKMVTASIETVVGTSGTAVVAIEYYENE